MVNDLRSELRALVESLVESLVVDLERIVERHAVLLVAERLGANLAPAAAAKETAAPRRRRATRAPSSPKPNGGPSGAPSPAVDGRTNRARILEYVHAHPGERSQVVRAALGLRGRAWERATGRLVRDGKLSREGKGALTTLHPAAGW